MTGAPNHMSFLAHDRSTEAAASAVFVLTERWRAALKPGADLPAYEEIALGHLGRFADNAALVRFEEDELTVLQITAHVTAWLHGISPEGSNAARSDCARVLRQLVHRAMQTRRPERQIVSRVENGIVDVHELLVLPLRTHWGMDVFLIYLSESKSRSSLIEQVYQSTREGLLAFAPVRQSDGRLHDLQIVTLNAGAANMMQLPEHALMWQHLSDLSLGAHRNFVFEKLFRVLESGEREEFELDYVRGDVRRYLKVTASALNDLLVVTLVDITELRTREASFRMMFEANPLPMWVIDAGSLRFLDVNTAAVERYGYDRARFLAMTALDLQLVEDGAASGSGPTNWTGSCDGAQVWRHLTADGATIHVLPYLRPLVLGGRQASLVAVIDVTERQLAEAELRRTRSFLDTIVENIPALLYVQDAVEHRVLLLNRAGEDLLGVPRQELIGTTSHDLFRPAGTHAQPVQDDPALRKGGGYTVVEERPIETRGKGMRLLQLKTLAVPDDAGKPRYILGIGEDVTERRAIEAKIAHMGHHDGLTSLPNRSLFYARLSALLEHHNRHAQPGAVLCLDLDGFKTVNDTLGHASGDTLLRAVADRLQVCVSEEDTVARFGGDEFAILMTDVSSPADVSRLAARIVEQLSRSFEIHGKDVVIGVSIGIAMIPSDGTTPDLLLNNADLALYRAKAEKRGTFRFFEPEMNARIQARRAFETDLRRAFAAGHLELFYQPILNLRDNRINVCETLLRWRHPERGFISPAEFIPVAEETGLINPIGEWVLREACREAATWPDAIKVAVNLSPIQFRQPSLVSAVVSALANAGLDPNRLEVEITESVLLADSKANLAVLHQLRGLGVRVAMDDFGTGYSSLSYLRTFPFDKIKIDQSFVRELGTNRHCAAIIRAVAGLGSDLGITTVAEGVETLAQRDHLQQEGCDEMQGFLFSRPVSVADLRRLFARNERGVRAA